MDSTLEIGARGERAAVDYLRREGFLIIETNWRNGRYELDIVAERGDRVHFVEVKCRKAGALTSPEDALDAKKARTLLRAVNDYIAMHNEERNCQIDLVAVDMTPDGTPRIRYIPDAVQPRW